MADCALLSMVSSGFGLSIFCDAIQKQFNDIMTDVLQRCVANTVSNGSRQPASDRGVYRKNSRVWSQAWSKTRPAVSWPAKRVPVPINPQVLPGLA